MVGTARKSASTSDASHIGEAYNSGRSQHVRRRELARRVGQFQRCRWHVVPESSSKTAHRTAQEDHSWCVGTCWHDDPEHQASTDEAKPQRVASIPSKAARCAAQEGASWRVGTSRISTQSIFRKTEEPGLCHVLPLLDWSELRQIRRVCNHLSECIHLRDLSLGSPQRRVWLDQALENAINIKARCKKKKESSSYKRSRLGTRHHMDEEMRKSWKYVPRNSAGLSYLDFGLYHGPPWSPGSLSNAAGTNTTAA